MHNEIKITELYTKIQSQLGKLIPEKWESIYLYAGFENQINSEQTWELYFYYFPKSVLKKNPINVYEVPNRFSLEEEEYIEHVKRLCETIKQLQDRKSVV